MVIYRIHCNSRNGKFFINSRLALDGFASGRTSEQIEAQLVHLTSGTKMLAGLKKN
jgi:hypothetical protein